MQPILFTTRPNNFTSALEYQLCTSISLVVWDEDLVALSRRRVILTGLDDQSDPFGWCWSITFPMHDTAQNHNPATHSLIFFFTMIPKSAMAKEIARLAMYVHNRYESQSLLQPRLLLPCDRYRGTMPTSSHGSSSKILPSSRPVAGFK